MLKRRTDLALEAAQLWQESAGEAGTLPGVESEEATREGYPVTTVRIRDEAGARALGKPVGRYVTLTLDGLARREEGAFGRAARAVAGELAGLCRKGLAETAEAEQPVVNLYALREYAARYIKHHPDIHPELMQMVRALQPTSEGIPVEVYCFTCDTNWVAYEAVQGAVFDHLLSVLPEFGLRCYQRSSDRDQCVETDSKQE